LAQARYLQRIQHIELSFHFPLCFTVPMWRSAALCFTCACLMMAYEQNDGAYCDVLDNGVEYSSLLQLDVHTRPHQRKESKQCLKFLHIPKTGGTSIDSVNMHQEAPVFDSLMHQTYQRIAEEMPNEFQTLYGGNLGTMYDKSHESFVRYTGLWQPAHRQCYHMAPQPEGGTCEDLHTSPSNDPTVASFFEGCTTFCVVREPLQRFISAYEMSVAGPCDGAGFDERLPSFLAELSEHPHTRGCLFAPQVEFVFGAKNKSLSTKQYCDRVLHTENLDQEFAALMTDMGETLTLPEHHSMGEEAYDAGCKVNRTEVSQTSKDLIYKHFLADYEAFGYAPP